MALYFLMEIFKKMSSKFYSLNFLLCGNKNSHVVIQNLKTFCFLANYSYMLALVQSSFPCQFNINIIQFLCLQKRRYFFISDFFQIRVLCIELFIKKIRKHKQDYHYLISFLMLVQNINAVISIAVAAAAAAKSLQSCPTLCDPIDGSPPGSPVPGILQARTLEWVAFPSPVHESEVAHCVRLFTTPWTAAYRAPPPRGFSRQEDWSGVPLPYYYTGGL